MAMENGPGLKMYFLVRLGIFQPAMLVYQRVMVNCWFGARVVWDSIAVHPRIPIPFIFADSRNPDHRAPNQQLTISELSKKKLISIRALVQTWIDDVVFCMVALEKTPSALALGDKIADHYLESGFALHKIKSLIGKQKFVFLNRFYTDGVEIAQTHKIAAKLYTGLDGDLTTWLDAAGSCPLLASMFTMFGAAAMVISRSRIPPPKSP